MPYSDPEKRRANSKRWRDEKMMEGYGKALYARRKQRLDNEIVLRLSVIEALRLLSLEKPDRAMVELRRALENAPPVDNPIEYMPEKKRGDR